MMDPWQTSQGRHEWHADDGKDMGTVGLCQAPLFDVGLGEIFLFHNNESKKPQFV